MKKLLSYYEKNHLKFFSKKTIRVMKLSPFLLIITIFQLWATETYSQLTKLSLNLENTRIADALKEIENHSEFYFLYSPKLIDVEKRVNIVAEQETIRDILTDVLGEDVMFAVHDRQIILMPKDKSEIIDKLQQQNVVTGKVIDSETGEPIPGVNIIVKGTTVGTMTDASGDYLLNVPNKNAILVFSFIGYSSQEIPLEGRSKLNVSLVSETVGLEEVVVIGYGTQRKKDLTGSVLRADIQTLQKQPNVSIVQFLQGTVPGLNVSQVQKAGESPTFNIRGVTSLSGEQQPLIILDEVIYRGNLIDLNPADIESIDVLKDNSAAAVYGSQAANGVIIITSKSGKGKNKKPSINYSSSFGIHTPSHELKPGTVEDFINKNIAIDFYLSRTETSGYLEPNQSYDPTYRFKSNIEAENYKKGLYTDWYDLLTNDQVFFQNQNLSLFSQTEHLDYFISVGFTTDQGYMLNEDFQRYNARINANNKITNWLSIGVQTFFSLSDNSGLNVPTEQRYRMPYDVAYDENGEMINYPGGITISPLVYSYQADDFDQRNNLFGNIFAKIDFPFIKGLSYKINFSNNVETTRKYTFQHYGVNFQGLGSKDYSNAYTMSSDNILSYKHVFNNVHSLDVTLLYGFEKRNYDNTSASSSVFVNQALGYNKLQAGSSSNQQVSSGAWKEASLYNMARLFYSFRDKYMLTGTIRRDGFSGFSENNKFGLFPSVAIGWVLNKESFFPESVNFVNNLKLRLSYGSTGNRTIGRYQTLARVEGGYRYVTESGSSVYGQSITSMSCSNLKWETTTGLNLGIDFGLFSSRINGTIDYYNNNTKNILYNVDIPSISRFDNFPTNLGKLHNHGLEISITSENIRTKHLLWNTTFVFSRNRDKLVSLLGFDNDGDGKEDDLISEGLFIGEPLCVNYHYEITGKMYQLGDVIPTGADVGTFIIVDQNTDGIIDQDDYVKLNYSDPSYRFSITSVLEYKNWSLNLLINSIQGGKNYYYAADNLIAHWGTGGDSFNYVNDEQHYRYTFPKGLDYWLPENPNAKYQRIDAKLSQQYVASRWTQRNFIRLQDVSLSYSFKPELLSKIRINALRLFLSGKNLLTITKWPGWDPETGERINMTGRPVLKSYVIGLDVEF